MRIYYYTDQPLDISKYTKKEIEKMLKEEEKRTKNYNTWEDTPEVKKGKY
ncbi:MAG TPA: hypothetical protein OIL76_09225 [Veillonellaceae bacterium]|nr:hypothetical protein [Veillonellaceae bacterium]